jgi:hypothetical protein
MADVPTVGAVSFSQLRGSTNNTGQGVSLGNLNLHNLNTPQRLGQVATSQTLGTSKKAPPLFSPSSQQGMVGLYSMKLANPYYTGPVLKAQRSLDNSTLDFWADADGALMSATGNVYSTWVGTGTANLLTWYDQSQNDMEALKYPPISLGGGTANPTTASLTTAPYGNGSYIYSASSQLSTGEFVGALFNSSGTYQQYTTSTASYSTSTGLYVPGSASTVVSGTTYNGEWVQIQLPYAIYLTAYYRLAAYTASVRNETSHVLAGSNNGTTWTLVNSASEPQYTSSTTINVNVTTAYSYYRLIALAVNTNGGGYWSLAQFDLYGRRSLTAGRNAVATTASGGNPPLIVIDPLSSIAPYLVGTATANHSAPFIGATGGPTLYVFPPAAMTSNGPQNITGYPAGGSGNYTVTESSVGYGAPGWLAFNSVIDGSDFWHTSDVGTYDSNGDATASATTPGFANGSWLQIQFPSAVTLYSYSMVTRTGWNNRTPYNFYIVGSNNGTAWTLVDNRTAITGWSPPTAKTFTIASPILTSFTYFRLVTTKLNAGEPSLQIANWSLNGSLTAPAAYQPPSSNVALVLPGTSGNYVNYGPTHPINFSLATSNLYVEALIYPNSVTATQVIIGRVPLTTVSLGDDWGLYIDTDSKLKLFMNNTVPSVSTAISAGTLTVNQWTHVAASYNSGTNQMYVFINGTVTGPTPFVGTPNYRTLNALLGAGNGLQYPFNGYIRDARVIQGGSVPTASFTPDQVPFGFVSPSYTPQMGIPVFALYRQYFANGKYVIYFPNGVATNSAYYGLTFNPQTITGAMMQYRTVSNPSTYQTFLAGSTDMSIKYTNNTLLGATTDFLG